MQAAALHQTWLERSHGEVRRGLKAIGRVPGENSCLSLCSAVLDLIIRYVRLSTERDLGPLREWADMIVTNPSVDVG